MRIHKIEVRPQVAKVSLLGAMVDVVTPGQAVDIITSWAEVKSRKYVVTPNLDHCVMLRKSQAFRDAYRDAGLVIPDGWPLVAASWTTRHFLKQRVTGSDLVHPLCAEAERKGISVFLMGSTFDTLVNSGRKLSHRFPHLEIAGVYSPPFGFERSHQLLGEMKDVLNAAGPGILFVALGAPKQEYWMQKYVHKLDVGAALGVGASLDFIAGTQRRAPNLARKLCLEAFWRAASDPRRLGKRYLVDAIWLPLLFLYHLKGAIAAASGNGRRGP